MLEKFYYLLFIIVFLISCKSKRAVIGERIQIFKKSELGVFQKEKIVIDTNLKTYVNYYGDYSVLNNIIDNYNSVIEFKESYFSNPIFINDKLYYLDKEGRLNGKKRVVDKKDNIKFAKISYYNDTFYLITGTNIVIAFDVDGNVKWRKELNVIPISNPVILQNNLYFTTNDNKTYNLNTDDGTIKWIHYGINSTTKILGVASPVIYKNYLIAAYSTGDLFVLDKNTGKFIINAKLTYKNNFSSSLDLVDIDSTPIIKDEILIASANNGNMIAINLEKLSVMWEKPISVISNILINKNFIFALNTDNSLFALNLKNGNIIWEEKLESKLRYKKLFFANNNIYIFNEIGYKVISLDGNIKENISKKLNLYSSPISINNVLYGIGKY